MSHCPSSVLVVGATGGIGQWVDAIVFTHGSNGAYCSDDRYWRDQPYRLLQSHLWVTFMTQQVMTK